MSRVTRRELLRNTMAVAAASRLTRVDREERSVRVLLIDADDWGVELFNEAKTPQMWRRAAQGTRFTRFWARALCSVFRAAVITGCESIRPANWTGKHIDPSSPFAGPQGPWFTSVLPGRKTMRGKVHVLGTPPDPAAQWPKCMVGAGRYDEYSGSHSNLNFGGTSYYIWTRGYATTAAHGTATCHTFATNDTYTDVSADIAARTEFIRASFNAVHKPNLATPPQNEPPGYTYSGGGVDNYLWHLDYRIGQLIDQAVAAGYVVIVCGDNGTSDAGKGTFFESGLNTPCFALGPNVPVAVSDRLVQCTDLAATCAELRGARFEARDSSSFADALQSWCSGAPARAHLTCSGYPGLGVPPVAGTVTRAARDERYKLLDDEGQQAFYDLVADPGEIKPIHPQSQRELASYQALLASLPS